MLFKHASDLLVITGKSNNSLLLFLTVVCLTEKQNTIYDQCYNPRSHPPSIIRTPHEQDKYTCTPNYADLED
jgi:hypothetical protein